MNVFVYHAHDHEGALLADALRRLVPPNTFQYLPVESTDRLRGWTAQCRRSGGVPRLPFVCICQDLTGLATHTHRVVQGEELVPPRTPLWSRGPGPDGVVHRRAAVLPGGARRWWGAAPVAGGHPASLIAGDHHPDRTVLPEQPAGPAGDERAITDATTTKRANADADATSPTHHGATSTAGGGADAERPYVVGQRAAALPELGGHPARQHRRGAGGRVGGGQCARAPEGQDGRPRG